MDGRLTVEEIGILSLFMSIANGAITLSLIEDIESNEAEMVNVLMTVALEQLSNYGLARANALMAGITGKESLIEKIRENWWGIPGGYAGG